MFAACAEHIEQVIDEYVDRYEISPDLTRLDAAAPGPAVPTNCLFCSRPPVYLLT